MDLPKDVETCWVLVNSQFAPNNIISLMCNVHPAPAHATKKKAWMEMAHGI